MEARSSPSLSHRPDQEGCADRLSQCTSFLKKQSFLQSAGPMTTSSQSADCVRCRMVSSGGYHHQNHDPSRRLGGVAPNWIKDFPVVGQGTIVFTADAPSPFSIVVRPKLSEGDLGWDQWISLEVLSDSARFTMSTGKSCGEEKRIVLKQVTGLVREEKAGCEPDRRVAYWFSYDRDRLVLKYGKGYRMEEATLMTFDFLASGGIPVEDPDRVRYNLKYLFSPTVRRQIEHYDLHDDDDDHDAGSLREAATTCNCVQPAREQVSLQHWRSSSSSASAVTKVLQQLQIADAGIDRTSEELENHVCSSATVPRASPPCTVTKKNLWQLSAASCACCVNGTTASLHPTAFLQTDCCSCSCVCVKRGMLPETASESTSVQRASVKRYISQETDGTIMVVSADLQNVHRSHFENRDYEVAFDKSPFVSNCPPFVKDSSDVCLLDLDCGKYTLSASLPPACQELYANISSKHIDLNYPPELDGLLVTDAIRYSINTRGMLLHEKLQEKKGEFGSDNEVYLRVTLGPNRASSPGVPYVLEIWPKSCGSPIHNHGNSFAVIKVLHGGLSMYIFNQHANHCQYKPLKSFTVMQNDVTWISPNWYQTHKLWNNTDDYCATLQCYMYGTEDSTQWPFFDYISPENRVAEFLPNTDFTFGEMREMVLQEYRSHVQQSPLDL